MRNATHKEKLETARRAQALHKTSLLQGVLAHLKKREKLEPDKSAFDAELITYLSDWKEKDEELQFLEKAIL